MTVGDGGSTGRNDGDTLAYCLGELRREDRDRYLTLLFAPRRGRAVTAALYAFNLECARAVAAGGQQPLLGQMRLQWWRDNLAPPSTEPVAAAGAVETNVNPVLAALRGRRDLLPHLLEMLAARERDLTDSPHATLPDVVAQAAATGGALAALAARLLDPRFEAAGRAAGTAYALAGMLRAIPFQRQDRGYQGRLCLPQDLLAAHGLAAADVWSGQNKAAVGACVAEVAAAAEDGLRAMAGLRRNAGPAGPALAPLLHGSLARAYLRRLAKAGHDPFSTNLGLHPLARPLSLCWRVLLRQP